MKKGLCWLRRDLRLHDNTALNQALLECDAVQLIFIFDPFILDKLPNKNDRRLTFIIDALKEIDTELRSHGSSLVIRYGNPVEEIPKLMTEFQADFIYANKDYEPYAKKRDQLIGPKLKLFKDSVIFEKEEILNGQRQIYKVFTPYKNKWLETIEIHPIPPKNPTSLFKKLNPFKAELNNTDIDWHQKLNFIETKSLLPGGRSEALKRLDQFHHHLNQYHEKRDIPSIDGTSQLSPYLRHGCLSVREMVRLAQTSKSEGAKIWLSEIIWRDFYQMILDANPQVEKFSFKKEYDQIIWQGKDEWFKAWCDGMTGYPIVDASMRCLAQTGLMHNRLRMITASFLCKTLLIDWRRGEKHFAHLLLDFDLAANNGGWQWCSSTGCDAQPYFRIFNPYTQSEKFDADGIFIKKWIPELKHLHGYDIHCPSPLLAPDYPQPIVSYPEMRQQALEMYALIKK